MPFYPSVRTLTLLLAGLLGASLGGCAVYDRPYASGYVQTMPPAGIAYYDYWYYPGVQVYYDINRHVYFYLGSSGWVEVRVLPPALRARLGHYVPLHSRYARPYRDYNEHRRKYPPNYYRETPRPPARHNGGSSPYPHNYYPQAPLKKPPEQYQRDRRYEPEYQRRQDNRYQQEYRQREDQRGQPRYQQAPVKKPPADDKRNSHGKDKQSGKSDKDSKSRNNKDKASGRDRDQRRDQDREQRDYR